MANTFKVLNWSAAAAAASNLYTVTHPVSATVKDTSATNTEFIAKAISVPLNAAIGLVAGKLVMETTDVLDVFSDGTSQIDVTLSVLEIT